MLFISYTLCPTKAPSFSRVSLPVASRVETSLVSHLRTLEKKECSQGEQLKEDRLLLGLPLLPGPCSARRWESYCLIKKSTQIVVPRSSFTGRAWKRTGCLSGVLMEEI